MDKNEISIEAKANSKILLMDAYVCLALQIFFLNPLLTYFFFFLSLIKKLIHANLLAMLLSTNTRQKGVIAVIDFPSIYS